MVTAEPPTRTAIALGWTSRVVELILVVLGILFTFVLEGRPSVVALGLWVFVAAVYVVVGGFRLRRSRKKPPGPRPDPLAAHRFRGNFLFAVIASLTGLTTAIDIGLAPANEPYGSELTGLGGVAIALSWVLLHAGYARRYEQLQYRAHGLVFPADPIEPGADQVSRNPGPVDFLYFAFTVGTNFSTSDVSVVTSRMRWHVMVHSVVSFFYNAAVVAFAIEILRG